MSARYGIAPFQQAGGALLERGDLLGYFEQLYAERSWQKAAGAPFKQHDIALSFHIANLLRHGGLGQLKIARGSGKCAMRGDRHKGPARRGGKNFRPIQSGAFRR